MLLTDETGIFLQSAASASLDDWFGDLGLEHWHIRYISLRRQRTKWAAGQDISC
jgi:hypothetical protein